MHGIEDKIAFFVKDQLPEFYQSDGPMFTAFIEAYYEWLETQPTSNVARNLIEYHDIDQTTDEFLEYFKSTFLNGFPGSFKAGAQITLKNILDFYKAKGTPRAIELLFRILFNDAAHVSYPSRDVMRPSNANYIRPTYIEVRAENITNLVSLEQKEIVGATSGAKAFVESIATRLINNIKVHVMYLSNVRGEFLRTEVIAPTDTGIQDEMPVIVGSLSAIDITLGGKDYAVGDTFDVTASSGKQGKIRVRETADATGLIDFNLANGGFGFSTNTNFTETIVNDQNLLVTNVINQAQTYNNTVVSVPTAFDWHEKRIDKADFFRFETVDQTLEQMTYLSALSFNQQAEVLIAANNATNPYVIGVDSNSNMIANGYIIDTNINGSNGIITIAPFSGTFGDQLKLTIAKAIATHDFFETEEIYEESEVQLSVANETGTFTVNSEVYGSVSGANGIVAAVNSTVITVNGSFGSWVSNDYVTAVTNTALTANTITVNVVTSGANAVITDIANSTSITIADITGTFNNGKKIKGVKTNAIATLQANPVNSGVSDLYLSGNVHVNNRAQVDVYSNTSVTARVLGSNSTQVGFANTKYANNLAGTFTANLAAPIIGRDSNTHANVLVVSTGSGAAFEIDTLENTEDITIYTDFVGENNVANVVYLDCVIDGGNSGIGFLNDVQIDAGGSGYSVGETLIFDLGGPGGGRPTTNATATISAIGAGGTVTGIQVATAGAGFYSNSTANAVNLNGSGLQVTGDFDYGYGFPKDPNGDYTTILDNVLTRFSGTIGTIASLGNINPGNNYSSDPFTSVYTKGIAKYDRKDLVLQLDNKNGTFVIGENVNQTVAQAGQELTFSSNTGPFTLGESLVQYHTALTANPVISATGEVYTLTATKASVQNVRLKTAFANGFMTVSTTNTTPFNSSNGVVGQLSAQTGVISTVTTVSQTQTAKGQVYAQTEDSVSLRRLSFSVGFNDAPGNFIFGSSSGANGNITTFYEDDLTRPIGDNAQLTAKTQAANGIVTSVDIIDSGFGYQHDANITLVSANTQKNIVVSGTANVTTTGIGEGYWADEESFLNTKYIHDNDYYQSHSYVVESGLSLDKYREVLLQVAHVAGTKLFGQVNKESLANTQMGLSNSSVTIGTTSGGAFTAS
jgi:hypothetical protein